MTTTPAGLTLTMLRKSLPLSYLLWALFGYLGAHRFYLGDWGWGILYLCTGGLFGVGWFVDAFTIPAQVDRANHASLAQLETAGLAPARLLAAPRRRSKKGEQARREQLLLQAARRGDGTITVAEAAMATGQTLGDADRQLNELAKNGYCDIENRPSGAVCYRFLESR